MRVLAPENDHRTITPAEWAHLRLMQDDARKGSFRPTNSDVADALEMLFRECRRLRSIVEAKYLDGFNDGWDAATAE